MEPVLEVYKRPENPGRPVVCMDETPRQRIGETRLPLTAQPGQPLRYDYEYERKGTCHVFMAVEPLAGQRLAEVIATKTVVDWTGCLQTISTHWPHADKITLVQDNLNPHTAGSVYKGIEKGVGGHGRKDLRALLVQSAHNALAQRGSPLHRWGWELAVRKHRNLAVAAVARKLTVSIRHLLMGHYTAMVETPQYLVTKLLKLSTLLGKQALKQAGFERRAAFVQHLFESINTSP
jgi:hypothetical protein